MKTCPTILLAPFVVLQHHLILYKYDYHNSHICTHKG